MLHTVIDMIDYHRLWCCVFKAVTVLGPHFETPTAKSLPDDVSGYQPVSLCCTLS